VKAELRGLKCSRRLLQARNGSARISVKSGLTCAKRESHAARPRRVFLFDLLNRPRN
jgi:hypothetical protein